MRCYTCKRYEPIGFVGGGKTYNYCNRGDMLYPIKGDVTKCELYKRRKNEKKETRT